MTLSAVSNAALAKSHISQQKTDTETKQTEKGRPNSSSENNLSRKSIDDNVTLSQTKKTNASSKVVDGQTTEKLLHQTIQSILTHSKQAVSAQATSSPEVAQEFLVEN